MERYYLLSVLIAIVLIESIRIINQVRKLNKEESFIFEYHEKLVEYNNSRGDDGLFVWLSQNAYKMQNYMGDFGIVSYRPPFAQYMINNYMIIVNGIDEIKNELKMGFGGNDHFHMVRDSILKYSGHINMRKEAELLVLKNPLRLLVSAIRNTLLVPFFVLTELGILNGRLVRWFEKSYLMRLLAGIVALLSMFSAVITIIIGWNEFLVLIESFIN